MKTEINPDTELRLAINKVIENHNTKTIEFHFIYSGKINHKELIKNYQEITDFLKSKME